ncbi:MAG: hypothetical protein KA368_21140 [Acidobacteria bacterium]|nr:hypothetical protein [Acidobacteriota bacterium]
MKEILALKLTEDGSISFTVHPLIIIVVAVLIGGIYWWRRRSILRDWETVQIEVPFGGGKVTIKPNHEVLKIAHQAWTELITRKVGLEFDEDHDVIVEVYDSWYAVFKEIRSLIKSVPAQKLRESFDAQKLSEVLIDTLNKGLRPHLTQWQARFRRWYAVELDKYPDLSPQEIQKQFIGYAELVTDLKKVNHQMIQFAEELRKIVRPS